MINTGSVENYFYKINVFVDTSYYIKAHNTEYNGKCISDFMKK